MSRTLPSYRYCRKRIIKGLDFKTLWETEILLDFTVDGSFELLSVSDVSTLYLIVATALFVADDEVVNS